MVVVGMVVVGVGVAAKVVLWRLGVVWSAWWMRCWQRVHVVVAPDLREDGWMW